MAVVVVGALPSCVAAGRGVRSLRRTVERLPLPRWRGAWPVLKRILKPVTVGSEKKKFRLDASKFPKKKNKKIGEGIPKHQKYVRRVCVCEAVFLARSVVVPHTRRVVEDL